MVTTFQPAHLDPVTLERTFAINRKKWERVIYYRKPAVWEGGRRNVEPLWITWGDSQPTKRADMIIRGFQPLAEFGYIEGGSEQNPSLLDLYGNWGPILCHPNGPAAFPLDQILAYRWYKEEGLRGACKGLLPPGVSPRSFPQLRGETIREFRCPECSERSSHEPKFLGRHLMNAHSYDRTDLINLGKEMGINFAVDLGKTSIEEAYAVEGAGEDAVAEEPPAFEVDAPELAPRGRRGR